MSNVKITMIRDDLSTRLIHLIKDVQCKKGAFENFKNTIFQIYQYVNVNILKRYIVMSDEKIKMIRDDLSTKLIHLTKDGYGLPVNRSIPGMKGAFENFINITGLGGNHENDEGVLKGSSYGLAGENIFKHKCICFTETPISKLAYILSNPDKNGMKYSHFGVMFEKRWIFQKGGRPVIYQPYSDFSRLPESYKYLHMTFKLDQNPDKDVDYTWEREWRICIDELRFTPNDVTLILPTRDCINLLIEHYTNNMKNLAFVCNDYQKIKRFPWNYIVLEDIGFPIPYTPPW